MSNSYWLGQEKKFLKAIEDIEIPNEKLDNVEFIVVKDSIDLNSMPSGGGCYWIWTNEPVIHSLHRHNTPQPFENGEIIYNGIAKDYVKGRVLHHLFGSPEAVWSGISVDIFTNKSVSHRKKACSPKGKVPYLNNHPIKNRTQLLNLHLSEEERNFIKNTSLDTCYFRNGINISEDKHKDFEFRVYYIIGLNSLYVEHI